MEKYQPGVGIAAGSLMIRWDMMNNICWQEQDPPNPGESINIFINFESVLSNLTMVKNLNSTVMFFKQELVLELEAAILNLVAHYRSYFRAGDCKPRVYLYYTDIDTTEEQSMKVYNSYYRSTYHNNYRKNPNYRVIGEFMTEIVIPEVELILTYIPGCYFVRSKRFDGSLLPKIIRELHPSRVNVIITGDVFDTLYLFQQGFTVIHVKRRYSNFKIVSTVLDSVQSIVTEESTFDLGILGSELYYKLLLSVRGSKIRNIRSARGFGYTKLLGTLREGIDSGLLLRDYNSIGSVIQLFPEQFREDIRKGYQCSDLDLQLSLLGKPDRDYVSTQLIDKVDNVSLEALNNQRFLNCQINLHGLLS